MFPAKEPKPTGSSAGAGGRVQFAHSSTFAREGKAAAAVSSVQDINGDVDAIVGQNR